MSITHLVKTCWALSSALNRSNMNTEMQIGLYGKLPAYGDFIFRNLNSTFINPWDEWLQHFISGSRQQLGDEWLNIYLSSPIWRFVISPGVLDNTMWAGFMMPSVDRVGRYFPVSVVKPFPASVNPVNFIVNQQNWFNQLETICLSALEGKIDADQLVAMMETVNVFPRDSYQPTQNMFDMGPMLFGVNSSADNSLNSMLPYMLNAALSTSLTSYSLWTTAGSELVSPVLFSCQGLPPVAGIASMLDGQWQQRNWKIPYNMILE